MYVRMSHLGMLICTHAQESGITEMCITQGCRWRTELVGTMFFGFLAMEDGEDSTAGPSQHTCTYLAESGAEASA